MAKKHLFLLFTLCSALLFSYSLVQENTAPEVRIISPNNKQKLPWTTLLPYEIEISDKEDGSSVYDEIDSNEVLLSVAYFPDSINVKKKMEEVEKNSELLPLIQSATCFTCHKVQGKLIGPSFSEIGKKYSATEENKIYLINKISKGSQGVWSDEIMPAQPELKRKSIVQILDWILDNAQDSNYSFYSGTEGTLKTLERPRDKIGNAIYVFHAQYTDHGLNKYDVSSKKGIHTLVLNVE